MRILKNIKRNRGNITILVLMLVLVALFLVATMVRYIYRDVGFTELDENKVRALNLAEAGISDMYMSLDKYYKDEISNLPTSPYTLDIVSQGEPQGSVTVAYEVNSSGGSVSSYTITANGIDKSGVGRTVKVKINVNQQNSIAMDIFDFIYINNSATYDNNSQAIEGPFYTEGNLVLANSGMLQSTTQGPIIVEGDLTMTGDATNLNSESLSVVGDVLIEGSSRINGGLVSIGGNLTMTGNTRIDNNLESPMIVMGDIDFEGSPEIGEIGKDLLLSYHGGISIPYGSIPDFIHADLDDSGTNPFVFEDPEYNVADIIDQVVSEVQGSSLIIDEDVFIYAIEGRADRVLFDYNNAHGRLKLSQEGGKYVLDIDGNIIINGTFTIGAEEWWDQTGPHTNTIYYRGKGLIYTTEDIDSHTYLIPLNTSGFPEDDFMVFVSNHDIILDVFRFNWISPDCSAPTLYVTAIANNLLNVKKGVLTGTTIAGGNLLVNKDFSKVCYLENLKEYLPPELPAESSGGGSTITFTQEWQEVAPE
jgi:hypothetical protein